MAPPSGTGAAGLFLYGLLAGMGVSGAALAAFKNRRELLAFIGEVLGKDLSKWAGGPRADEGRASEFGAVLHSVEESQASVPRRTSNLHVIFIRHAQSVNNVTADQVQKEFEGSPYAPNSPAQKAYEERRDLDPELSAIGTMQVNGLKQHQHLRRIRLRDLASLGRVSMVCSPMLRALLTSDTLAERLEVRVDVQPDVCERGGLYRGHGPDQQWESGMNRDAMKAKFPRHDCEKIGEDGWWKSETSGFEGTKQFDGRINRTVQWLKEQAQAYTKEYRARKEAGTLDETAEGQPELKDYIVVVSHADFLNSLMTRLLKLPETGLYTFYHENTSVSHLELYFPKSTPETLSCRLRVSNSHPLVL